MNKKGFVLMETLVVTIFVLVIFTLLYNSAVPLLGRYETLSYYNDLDTTYDLYHLRNLIRKDPNYLEILNKNYQKIECGNNTLADYDYCSRTFQILRIDSLDELIYFQKESLEQVLNDETISMDVKDYLKYETFEENVLLLQNDGYISYINLDFSKGQAGSLLKNNLLSNMYEKECNSSVLEDENIYFSGSNDCVDFNYVEYSGRLWRVISISKTGNMKMITEESLGEINYNLKDDSRFYISDQNHASIYDWLNVDFLNTLNQATEILNLEDKWNTNLTTSGDKKLSQDDLISSKIGLLTSYEYYKSYQNATAETGYLKKPFSWWLLNRYNENNVWVVKESGVMDSSRVLITNQVRPVVSLYANQKIRSGNGSRNNPFQLE